MAREVFCLYLKKSAPGLDFQLYPGELGKKFSKTLVKKPSALWQAKQTMLINEKKLSMRNPEHFKMLEEQMQQFLFEGAEVAIEGYVPPSKA